MTLVQQDTKLASFAAEWKKTTLPFSSETLENATTLINTMDFPTTRVENWKYTRVTKISNKTFTQDTVAPTLDKLPALPYQDAYTVVFVNGFYNAALSTTSFEDGLSVSLIEDAPETANFIGKMPTEKNVFTALNTLHATSGLFIKVSANKVIEKPVQVVYISTGEHKVANIRNVFVAEKFAEARITQVFLSKNSNECFTNVVSESYVEDTSHLVVDRIQYEDDSNFHVSFDYIAQPKNTNFTLNTITLNGALVRNDVKADINGENSFVYMNGAYVLKDSQHVDNHTYVNHFVGHCESHELYKGVLDGKSTGVFNGMIHVHPNAQKIDSYQSNGNVLLSDTAHAYSKPELEIYADDVKCSHGSTIGQLNEEAIYYLRARGISKETARAMMVTAFIGDVLDNLENEELVEYIHDILEARFGWTF